MTMYLLPKVSIAPISATWGYLSRCLSDVSCLWAPELHKGDFGGNPPRVWFLHARMQESACSGVRQGLSYTSEEKLV